MIIAVDFDGVLCKDEFPEIGPTNYDMVSLIRQLIDAGHEVILWTSRTGPELDNAVTWCNDIGLHFCAINENAPSNVAKYKTRYPQGTRKVYADVYIDDHNAGCDGDAGYKSMLNQVRKGVKLWKVTEVN